MIRLAVKTCAEPGKTIRLSSEDWHYLTRVMRRRPSDHIWVVTADHQNWECVLLDDQRVEFLQPGSERRLLSRYITLYQALLKGDHVSRVVDGGTQAGISRFVPVVSDRCIVRDVSEQKLRRWQMIAKEAAEQCGRLDVPEIAPLTPIHSLMAEPRGASFVLSPNASYHDIWRDLPGVERVSLVVGPEGGLTGQEEEVLVQAGFSPLSLGPLVYRAENAGAYAAVLFLQ